MKAAIILKDAYLDDFDNSYDLIIGADRGSIQAIKYNIIPDISIGDFDSVNDEEFKLIKEKSIKVIKLNPIKDESDTHEAVMLAKKYDSVEILGGIQGKRIEHLISNIIDIINNKNVLIKDKNTLIETVCDNNYTVRTNYKYVSLYAVKDSIISLEGFKYNLCNYTLKINDPLCLSNEIINNPKITLNKGKLLIIYSHGD